MPGIPPNAVELVKSKFKSLFKSKSSTKKANAEDKPADTKPVETKPIDATPTVNNGVAPTDTAPADKPTPAAVPTTKETPEEFKPVAAVGEATTSEQKPAEPKISEPEPVVAPKPDILTSEPTPTPIETKKDVTAVDVAPTEATQPVKTSETAPVEKKEEHTIPSSIEEASKPTAIESEPVAKPVEAPAEAKKEVEKAAASSAAPTTTTA